MPLNLNRKCHSLRGALLRKIGNTWIPPYLINTKWLCGFRPNTIHNGTANHCSQNLSCYVEKGSEDTHLSAGQEAQDDGRIQMGTTDVTYTYIGLMWQLQSQMQMLLLFPGQGGNHLCALLQPIGRWRQRRSFPGTQPELASKMPTF